MTRRVTFATARGAGRLPLGGEVAERRASAGGQPLSADALLDELGSGISTKTRAVVVTSEAPLRAGLVLGSPDFMFY